MGGITTTNFILVDLFRESFAFLNWIIQVANQMELFGNKIML